MKLTICLKDPDGVNMAAEIAAEENPVEGMDIYEQRKAMYQHMRPWLAHWGEGVVIEIDTEANTATVVRAK